MDPEIEAMSQVVKALESLDEPARARVLQWAGERFNVTFKKVASTSRSSNAKTGVDEQETDEETEGKAKQFESLAELIAEASPSSDADKVLVAGYWHQKIEGSEELTSHQINKDLKNLGHGMFNINQKFDALIEQKPQLVLQLKKSGLTKQARKKYKLTKAGIDRVEEMFAQK